MKLIEKTLLRLNRISPSQYSSLKRCAYRVVLANTYKNPLLPYPPNGHLGNVIHECIRLILTKQIQDDKEFNDLWSKLIEEEEAILKKLGFDFLTPLKRTVKGYSIKKLQVKSLLRKGVRNVKDKKKEKLNFNNEKWLSSKDGLIGGKVDLIIEVDDEVKLIDFKSGRIILQEGDIKQDYEDQLKLYAYLYSEEFGKFPKELTIIDLTRKKYHVDFSNQECINLADESRQILHKVNHETDQNKRKELSNPSYSNCNFCLYKPACKYHWNISSDEESEFVNLKGELIAINKYINGNISATLRVDGQKIVISQIDTRFENELRLIINSKVSFYNLKKNLEKESYQAIKTTTIYEQ